MKTVEFLSGNTQQTIRFGVQLARHLKAGDILCLFGDLGSGKTTLTKGIARRLKIDANRVNSPSFVLMNVYHGRLPLFHFDFYRLNKAREISAIGYEEFFYDDGITVIEWPQRLEGFLPDGYLCVRLFFKGEQQRLIKVSARGERARDIIKLLSADRP